MSYKEDQNKKINQEYKKSIIKMVEGLKSEKFLSQIYTLIKIHIEKGRD